MKYVCSLIVVNDMKIARGFYEELLGQKVMYDFGENVVFEGGFAIHLAEHYNKLLGEGNKTIIEKTNNFELYFETDEIETFFDPDLHIVEVGEPMEPVNN